MGGFNFCLLTFLFEIGTLLALCRKVMAICFGMLNKSIENSSGLEH